MSGIYDMEDPTVYYWVVARRQGTARRIWDFAMTIVGLHLTWLLVAAICFMGWATLGRFLYKFGLPEHWAVWPAMLVTLGWLLASSRRHYFRKRTFGAPRDVYWMGACLLSIGAVVYCMVFSRGGFEGPVRDFPQWMAFILDNYLHVVLFDMPDVFDLRVSAIRPVSVYARTMTLLLRFLMAVSVLEFLLEGWRNCFADERFLGATRECCDWCRHAMMPEALFIRRMYRLKKTGDPECSMTDFVNAVK